MIELLSLYHTIPAAQKQQFEKVVSSVQRKKGDLLLCEGEVQKDLLLVESGVAFLYDDANNVRRVIDFFYNNRFCADYRSFTQQSPTRYCIECLSDCKIERISYASFQEALESSPAIDKAYRMLLERMLAAAIRQNENQKILSMEDRFKRVVAQKPELFALVPHKYIASYTNIDVTNFSKLYNKHHVKNGLQYE